MNINNLFIGVQTTSLPTIISPAVSGTSLDTAGMVIYSERGATDGVHEITSMNLVSLRLGRFRSGYYGHYCIKNFFDNLQGGVGARLIVKRMQRNGATAASLQVLDNQSTPANTFLIQAGQLGRVDVGAWGNRLRVLIIDSSRASSTLSSAISIGDTNFTPDSVAPFELHDWVQIGTEYKKITSIDEVNGTITVNSAFTSAHAVNTQVQVRDFTIKVYLLDDTNGSLDLVETFTNLNIEPDSDFYFATRINHKDLGSNYIRVTDQITTTKTFSNFPQTVPDDITNVVPLTGGVEGTALSPSAYLAEYDYLKNAGCLWITNCEDFSEVVADDGEQYCFNSGPKMIWVGAANLSDLTSFQTELAWINRRRKSREQPAVFYHTWFSVDDPLGNVLNPRKNIPPVGGQMAHWIYVVNLRGVHKVAAGRNQVLAGIRGLVNERTDPVELRDLTNAGFILTSSDSGVYFNRSGRTPSKAPEYKFMNAPLMKIYFKKSFEDSLKNLENEMDAQKLLNSIERAMYEFADLMYRGSSNAGTESAFASFIKPDGNFSGFKDVVKIEVNDPVLNPYQDVMAGVLKANFYFMPPAPAERILIGVGLIFSVN